MAHNLWFADEVMERAMRMERVFRDRSNLLEIYNNEDLLSLTDELAEVLSPATSRSPSIPALLQVCTALRFYATGTFLNAVGDTVGLSKAVTQWVSAKLLCHGWYTGYQGHFQISSLSFQTNWLS